MFLNSLETNKNGELKKISIKSILPKANAKIIGYIATFLILLCFNTPNNLLNAQPTVKVFPSHLTRLNHAGPYNNGTTFIDDFEKDYGIKFVYFDAAPTGTLTSAMVQTQLRSAFSPKSIGKFYAHFKSNVNTIDAGAFANLTTIVGASFVNVKNIGNNAFLNCRNLTEIMFGGVHFYDDIVGGPGFSLGAGS